MNEYAQLSLFAPEFPEWKNITIEWLFNYLSMLYPEMKFQLEKYIDWNDEECCHIIQTAFKKVELTFDIGEYDDCVTWNKNKNYVGCGTMQKYGHWSGMGETYDCWEDFKERVPLRIQHCKKSAEDYKTGNYEKLQSEVG